MVFQTTKKTIHISFSFTNGPSGGGNKFLLGLRKELRKRHIYSETLSDADLVLINSFHRGQERLVSSVIREKVRRPSLRILHRVDGPFSLVRGRPDHADSSVAALQKLLADGTVFQTEWSKTECLKAGIEDNRPCAVIGNAPQKEIFYSNETFDEPRGPLRLAASSWSANPNKGFEFYQWMDKNLNWADFQMTFIGNSPLSFQNIEVIPPVDSAYLGQILRQHDVYISASRNEPCSNAVLEALACGLPVMAFNGGGTPELVGGGGVFFSSTADISDALAALRENYTNYRNCIEVTPLETVTSRYVDFAETLLSLNARPAPTFKSRVIFWANHLSLFSRLFAQRIFAKQNS